MNIDSKILVCGASGMVGSAIVRNLEKNGYLNIIKVTRQDVDLTNQHDVEEYFSKIKPEYVFLSAAKVGGILENFDRPAEFIYDNLMIQNNIINSSYKCDVKKLLFLGSSCIYPKVTEQPISEDQLMTGTLEPTNDSYAIAKIAGIKLCQSYKKQYGFNAISLMPCNLYGPNDNFDFDTSHVLSGLIAKFHTAKKSNLPYVECWGDGSPRREFLHVDDLADACLFCMKNYEESEILNIGAGVDITVKELASKIAEMVGYSGEIKWDTSRPNGTLKNFLNVTKLRNLGWKHSVELDDGLNQTYDWYLRYYNV